MKVVLVEWSDSQSSGDMVWEDRDAGPLEAAFVRTVGFLLRDDPSGVELVMGYHADQQCGRWFIPRGCIVRVTEWPTSHQTASPPAG